MGRPGQKLDRLSCFARLRTGLGAAGSIDAAEELPPGFDASRPEESYGQWVDARRRRELGQFFTPAAVAELMCRWLLATRPASVLDPAVGPGILLRTFLKHRSNCEATGIDFDPLALEACRRALRDASATRLVRADFLTWPDESRFDAIIANPPYLRHHDLDYEGDIHQVIGQRSGVRLSRLTNAYGLFLLEICRRLKPGGRAALVIPGEWLNANFGRPLKHFLLDQRLLQVLVYFSHAQTVFDDALTTACLLFVEKTVDGREEPVVTAFVQPDADWRALEDVLDGACVSRDGVIVHSFRGADLRAAEKWNAMLQYGSRETPPGFVTLGRLATTRRGIATGANAFFHLSPSRMAEHCLPVSIARDCVGRAADAPGLVFDSAELSNLKRRDRRCRLLCFSKKLDVASRRYVRNGQHQGLPRRFLLSRRDPWYAMEKQSPAPIWAAVFGRKELRFVWNQAGVLNLTTFHGVYPKFSDPTTIKALVACLNSDVARRLAKTQQRVYGGGLLKFEPGDLLGIPTPDVTATSASTRQALAGLLDELHQAISSGRDDQPIRRRLDQAVLRAASAAI